MTDLDFVHFLTRCAASLAPGGVIVIKDNAVSSAEDEESERGGPAFSLDLGDHSVCRSFDYFQAIFALSNLKIILYERQSGFPDDIFPVPMMALARIDE